MIDKTLIIVCAVLSFVWIGVSSVCLSESAAGRVLPLSNAQADVFGFDVVSGQQGRRAKFRGSGRGLLVVRVFLPLVRPKPEAR